VLISTPEYQRIVHDWKPSATEFQFHLSSDTSILTPQNSDTLIGDALPFTGDAPFTAPKGILALVILVPVLADLFRALLQPKVVLVLLDSPLLSYYYQE
jgi:hypothetical protein